MKKYRIVFPLLLSCILWYSCTDWLDYKPSDKQSEEQQFSSKDGFYAAVNGVYNRMSGNSLYGKYLSYDMIDILGQYYAVEQSDESDYYKLAGSDRVGLFERVGYRRTEQYMERSLFDDYEYQCGIEEHRG